MSKKFGSQRNNMRKKVYRLRTKGLLSWAAIAAELEVAPRTARTLFQEAAGTHQHHDHLPNKGGRFPSGQHTEDDTLIVFFPEAERYLVGDGTHNAWFKQEVN